MQSHSRQRKLQTREGAGFPTSSASCSLPVQDAHCDATISAMKHYALTKLLCADKFALRATTVVRHSTWLRQVLWPTQCRSSLISRPSRSEHEHWSCQHRRQKCRVHGHCLSSKSKRAVRVAMLNGSIQSASNLHQMLTHRGHDPAQNIKKARLQLRQLKTAGSYTVRSRPTLVQ